MSEQDLQSLSFPILDEKQIAQMARCADARSRTFRDGQALFSIGERNMNFFIVKSGAVEICDYSGDRPNSVTVHHKGQFTGEIAHLTGQPAIVAAIARGDTEVYEISVDALRRALNQCPTISDIILQAFISRRQLLRDSPDFTGLRVIGSRYSPDTFRVRDFLAKNRIVFRWLDLENDPDIGLMLKHFGMTEADTPVVAFGAMLLLRNPSNRQLADAIGMRQPLEHSVYDLVVVGGGPAGLAAAVYASSEGLRTVVIESAAPGGQAGSSMRIENYLGFPTGVTGTELAGRAILQANKFGARFSVPTEVDRLTFEKTYSVLRLDGGETVTARCLLIATGAAYRRLGVEGCERFEGTGVYYAATPAEGQLCLGAQVVVVGGGNSAGQAVVYLAGLAERVLLALRGDDLYRNMSSYLAKRIEELPNVVVQYNSAIRRMSGNGHLESVEIDDSKTGESVSVKTPAVFSFIGADPRTNWLPPEIERDEKGFVETGISLASSRYWTHVRQPFLLETSRAGVFAAGDVRAGSVKRVASAVGEGAMAVQFVHEFLKQA